MRIRGDGPPHADQPGIAHCGADRLEQFGCGQDSEQQIDRNSEQKRRGRPAGQHTGPKRSPAEARPSHDHQHAVQGIDRSKVLPEVGVGLRGEHKGQQGRVGEIHEGEAIEESSHQAQAGDARALRGIQPQHHGRHRQERQIVEPKLHGEEAAVNPLLHVRQGVESRGKDCPQGDESAG